MKVSDFISQNIQEYPTLYKDVDYEKSKLKVLNHVFFTIGNGMVMAETVNPENDGYVVEPKYKRDKTTGDWTRIKDKSYGVAKYKPIPKDYFESIVYYVYTLAEAYPIETTKYKSEQGRQRLYFRYSSKVDSSQNEPKVHKAESLYSFQPYPFSKEYSIACKVFYDGIFLQEDWMNELIILCRRTLEYFTDEEQYKNDSYYPTERSIKYDVNYFKERFERGGMAAVNDLQKTWQYEVKDTLPDYDEVKARKNDSWTKFHAKQLKFLNEFLEKFDKK